MSLDCPFLITPSVFSNVYVYCFNKVNTDVLVRKLLRWNDQLALGESGFLFLVMTKYIDYMTMKNVLKTSYRLNIYTVRQKLSTTWLVSIIYFLIYDKRDDFNFKIINFPNMCSNIPASPAYGIYISQLIRYARASSNYSDFLKRHLCLKNRLLDQGYKKIRLIRSLKKFIFRYQDLVGIYSVSADTMVKDTFSYSENV